MAVMAFVKSHRDLMQNDDLQRSINFALLEYQRQLCEQRSDVNSAAASHFRAMGALEFVQVLKTLGENVRMPAPTVVQNLNHGV